MQKKRHTYRIVLLPLCLVASCAAWIVSVPALDWPQYRGPNHNGVSSELIRTNWTEEPPRLLWKRALEPALSSLAIGGSRAYTQVRRPTGSGEQEFCLALNADTGEELWATPLGIADYPHGGVGLDDGPRSTPTVDGDRVYVLTSYLRIACMEAATGQIVWSRDLVQELGAIVIPWQNAASPLLMGDLIYLNCYAPGGSLMALRKVDGTTAWQGQNDGLTQSTPIAATIAGTPQVIFFTQIGLVSVAPESGNVFWRYSLPQSTSTAASPVVADDAVYGSAGYGVGAGVARISRNGTGLTAQEVWRTRGANMNHWATPVYHEGHFYGIYGHSLVRLSCVEAATGTVTWNQEGVGYGSVLVVAGNILMFTDTGDIALVKPDSTAYTEITRFKAVEGRCWNVAAISNGRIYARSTTQAAAYDVSSTVTVPPPKMPLKLFPVLASGNNGFSLRIANEDGSPLDPARLPQIEVFATSDLMLGPAGWSVLLVTPALTNGEFIIEDPLGLSAPQRFFKAQER